MNDIARGSGMGLLDKIDQDKTDKDSKFVSVRMLVTKLSELENCSLSASAKAILYLLKGSSEREVIKYCSKACAENEYESFAQYGTCSSTHTLLRSIQEINKFYVYDIPLNHPRGNRVFPRDVCDFETHGWYKQDLLKFFYGSAVYSWLGGDSLIQNIDRCADILSMNVPDHPHYAPKLAAGYAAWVACTTNERYQNNGKTTKANIISWLKENAEEYGLVKLDGTRNEHAIEEQIAKVVNWDVCGGVPPTPKK